MHFMQKATSNLSLLVQQILEIIELNGLTQDELGRLTKVSQGHLSKILRGELSPGPRVRRQLTAFAQRQFSSVAEGAEGGLGQEVATFAAGSPEFADLIRAALRIMQNMHSLKA